LTAQWPSSLPVLPLLGLVDVSYRVQVQQAIDRNVLVAA
jgi:hypothetical protein